CRAEDRRRRALRVATTPSLRRCRLHLEPRARARYERQSGIRRGLLGLPDRRVGGSDAGGGRSQTGRVIRLALLAPLALLALLVGVAANPVAAAPAAPV